MTTTTYSHLASPATELPPLNDLRGDLSIHSRRGPEGGGNDVGDDGFVFGTFLSSVLHMHKGIDLPPYPLLPGFCQCSGRLTDARANLLHDCTELGNLI